MEAAEAVIGAGDPSDSISDRDLVIRLLATLPPRSRAAVVYRYLHDMSDADLAQALDCRPGTVRSLLSRALVSLRTEWSRGQERASIQRPGSAL